MVRKEPRNEQTLCRAVICLIGKRRGEAIIKAEPLDTVVRTVPAVEWRFETRTERFALEHTRVESFPKQIAKGKRFTQLFRPLESELVERLPGAFFLTGDAQETRVPTEQHTPIRQALSAWMVEIAASLEPEDEVGPSGNCELTDNPPGVPFQVTLHRDSRRGSKLLVMQTRPSDLTDLRRKRIREAMNRKCPKLLQEKLGGRTSILVLESNDVTLANRRAVTEAVVAELRTRSDAPDIVFVARTGIRPWNAWLIKEGSSISPGIAGCGPFIVDSTCGTA